MCIRDRLTSVAFESACRTRLITIVYVSILVAPLEPVVHPRADAALVTRLIKVDHGAQWLSGAPLYIRRHRSELGVDSKRTDDMQSRDLMDAQERVLLRRRGVQSPAAAHGTAKRSAVSPTPAISPEAL